ncbi:putative s-adenosylmethionine-dependent methyltransferase protein [Ceratocystis lukuohia]|uniref:Protein-lysine N-methyltransferase EFM4 n=1 Tax=Ceratocystis lukuohia TaxID=2019550 RepID=A0ABR4MII3_9PEZI
MVTSKGSPKPAHLEPSKLGTREYWDSLYVREKSNHEANPRDKGTVWFDDSNAESKVLRFLCARAIDDPVPESSPAGCGSGSDSDSDSESDNTDLDSEPENEGEDATNSPHKDLSYRTSSFLDLGCGNGSLLFALRRRGFAGPRLGIDYSVASIDFATQIAAAAGTPDGALAFSQWDVLKGAFSDVLGDINGSRPEFAQTATGFDVVLDKGTFDAISLSDETGVHGRRVCEDYARRVLHLVRRGGILVITSCNWTEAELISWFEKPVPEENSSVSGHEDDAGRWVLDGRVKYRAFSFGGVTGQTISTLCFRRV